MAIREQSDALADAIQLVRAPSLTPREAEVLGLIAEGLSTRGIAERLVVSEQAITYHVGNLLSKFGCENRTGMVSRAFFLGYLDSFTWPPRVALERSGEGRSSVRRRNDFRRGQQA